MSVILSRLFVQSEYVNATTLSSVLKRDIQTFVVEKWCIYKYNMAVRFFFVILFVIGFTIGNGLLCVQGLSQQINTPQFQKDFEVKEYFNKMMK